MSDFCSNNTEVISDSNYAANYQTPTRRSCLPNSGTGFSTNHISTNGIINVEALQTHINGLISANETTPPNIQEADIVTNPAKVFAEKSALLRTNITSEYCFYYKRYTYILQQILTTAATSTNLSSNGDYNTKKSKTVEINSKLNQILQILQGLINARITTLKNYYGENTGVNKLNDDLNATRSNLLEHSRLMKKSSMEHDAKSAMVDYSVEKNSSSRNLMAIYGFMNIVAAGLIFYLYRNAKSQ